MSLLFYNLFIQVYLIGIKVYALFNSKAKLWADGRRDWREKMGAVLSGHEKMIWVHCSSVGEFEQGRNLIEALKHKYPGRKILLTFFSPSGYELRKDYSYADHVFYLPIDTWRNARDFVDLVDPWLVVFVKYEFWYHYLTTLKRRNIPVLLISGIFREDQPFFKWYGYLFRKILYSFTRFFVQDQASKQLLEKLGITGNVIIAGDTRYDRVLSIAGQIKPLPLIDNFLNGQPAFIAGSTWQEDERILSGVLNHLPGHYKLIIAPHEINAERMASVQKLFSNAVLYSELKEGVTDGKDKKVLIVNNIGMLSSLYYYGKIAMVGGGFQKGGIHNILEPAVFGLPVIIGPAYQKFLEATELVNLGYCFSISNTEDCKQIVDKLVNDDNYYSSIHQSLHSFMQQKAGATNTILSYIDAHHWL